MQEQKDEKLIYDHKWVESQLLSEMIVKQDTHVTASFNDPKPGIYSCGH